MTDFDAFERVMWAGRAASYERVFARMAAHTADALLDATGVGRGTDVLDVGTGPGTVAAAAWRRGAQVRAIDADPQMVETAARNVPGLDVRLAQLPELPFPDTAFDAAVGNFVINHVGAPDAALSELRRVLRAGGRLALTCWPLPGSKAQSIVSDAMERAGVSWPDDVPKTPFHTHGNPAAFRDLVAGAGFSDVVIDEIVWEHVVDPEVWWSGPLGGVGSTGYLLTRQDQATIARVKAAYDDMIAEYATADGRVALPARALLAHGVR
ncbi:MAG TPA: methyltransferase domain-containing protein [Streptosporangiaceae bacterium]|nr:methyltransferase domain-containing protein [Streptosporangiaceae bacterium]